MERIALIDVSSEDDFLISSSVEGLQSSESCGRHHCFGLSEADSSLQVENPAKCSMQVEQVPVLSESPKSMARVSGKYNLRKSLAWDNAFFTCEGVLDPEELAIVNSTFRKAGTCVLPVIQEDTRKSTESSTTLDSDSWAIEGLEVDLFENLRASIQKSQNVCGKASPMAHSSSTSRSGKLNVPGLGCKIDYTSSSSSKNVELRFQNKAPVTSKKRGVSKQQLEETSKETPSCPRMAHSGSGDQKLSLKPPRIASRVPIAANKRTSASGSVQTKSNTAKVLTVAGNVGSCQSVVVSKKLTPGDTHNVTSRSAPSPKYSSVSPSTKKLSAASCSSYSRSGSTSSDRTGKAVLESFRKKTESRNFDQSSSVVANNSHLRVFKSKNGSRNANITIKISSSVSPNSSIDSMASGSSSSSISTARKPNSSSGTLDKFSPSPCLGVSSGSDVPHEKSGAVLQSQRVNKASSGTRVLSDSALDATRCSNINAGAKGFKPSGLRLPSPKIGYFDAEKPLPRSSSKCSQRGPQVSLLRNTSGINNDAGTIKQKPSKLHSATSTDSNSHHTGATGFSSSTSTGSASLSLVQLSKPSSEVSGSLRTTQNQFETCSNVQKDLSPIIAQDIYLTHCEVGVEKLDTAECCQFSNLSAEEHSNEDQYQSMITKTSITKGQKPVVSGEASFDVGQKSTQPSMWNGEEVSNEQSSSVLYVQGGCVENNLQFPKHDEKENVLPSEDQVSGLNRHLEIENFNMIVGHMGEKLSSLSIVSEHDDAGNMKFCPHSADSFVQDQKMNFLRSPSKPCFLSVCPTTVDLRPSSRTPLADSYWNRSGLSKSEMESTEKLTDASISVFPEEGTQPHASIHNSDPEVNVGQ